VIFSSHILYDVEEVCSDVIMIKKGRMVVSGKIEELKKIDRSVFEVRLKGDPDRYLELLVQRGCRCERGRRNMVRIILPPESDARLIFDAAQETGVQVRHLMHKRDTLEDVFIGAIAETAQV
jgi:ABC-2 type transport system ATP-binding protein